MAVEINNRTRNKINLPLVKKISSAFLKKYKINKKDLSVAFVGDAEIKKINKKYRGIGKPTDVLSFNGEGDFLGEIIIDYNQIKKQAKENRGADRKFIDDELSFILVHGLLHLLGYNDEMEKDRIKMIAMGEKFIGFIKS